MALTRRQRDFAQYYANDPETRGNAYQSALKAGFSKRTIQGYSSKLANNKEIKELVKNFEDLQEKRFTVTIADKIKIAWENYLYYRSLGKHQIAQKWYEEHGKLAGHYVQRSEISQDSTVTISQDKINEAVRLARIQYEQPTN